jgi:hypothetical protein
VPLKTPPSLFSEKIAAVLRRFIISSGKEIKLFSRRFNPSSLYLVILSSPETPS